jgi:abhydrolase domain-containing protein 1/3
MKDGGEVALDWLTTDCSESSPILIILPGLTGESQSEYIKALVTAGNQKGMRCVVFINRGLGGMELKTPRLYCAANCEDLAEAVNHVHQKYPDCLKGAAGVSMGGLILGDNFNF